MWSRWFRWSRWSKWSKLTVRPIVVRIVGLIRVVGWPGWSRRSRWFRWSRIISLDDMHSENIWFSWSKASNYQEKAICQDGRMDTRTDGHTNRWNCEERAKTLDSEFAISVKISENPPHARFWNVVDGGCQHICLFGNIFRDLFLPQSSRMKNHHFVQMGGIA